jgi:hypothetical protein
MSRLAIPAFELLLMGALLLAPGRRARAFLVASLLGLTLSLVAQSTPRHVGDAGEYLAMSLNLARFSRPSLTPDELVQARALFPGDVDIHLEMPELRGPDGRQDLPHFWFYPLLAAPFVRGALAAGAHPLTGFTALNITLLIGVAALLATRVPSAVVLIVAAGPVLWWIDKAHIEVFTFSLITTALLLLPSSPWWSIVAFGTAATQNPPMAGAMGIAIAFALYKRGWRDRRVWIASMAGGILAAIHPLYYHSRLGVWSGLYQGIDFHWPSIRELTTVAFDPNLGIFVHDPILLVAIVFALVELVTRPGRHALDMEVGTVAAVAALFLLSFTQTTNFNSGGTPGPSRYGLWLVPFAVPICAAVPSGARWIRVLAAAAVVWCASSFAPNLPEQYLRPTRLAADIWRLRPGLDDPLAEVFAERVAGHERAMPPIATAGCEKVLLVGDGSGAEWPERCASVSVPDFCRDKGALCYANRTDTSYRFVPAPSPPAWRLEIGRGGSGGRWNEGTLAIRQTPELRVPMAMWHDEGWSYPERLTAVTPDVVSREWRWIDEQARLGVMSSEPTVAQLTIVARSLNKPRHVKISVDDVEVVTLVISPKIAEYQTPAFNLGPGSTLITLEGLDGSEQPATGDPRRLSVAVFRVELAAKKR